MNEICQACGERPAAHKHHRKRRSQGGEDSGPNIMHVCAPCHNFIHGHPATSYELGWLVKSWDEVTPLKSKLEKATEEHEHEGKCLKCGTEIRTKPKRKVERKSPTRSTYQLNFTDGTVTKDEFLEAADRVEGIISEREERDRSVLMTCMDALSYVLLNEGRPE